MKPTPQRPRIIIAHVEGSGTPVVKEGPASMIVKVPSATQFWQNEPNPKLPNRYPSPSTADKFALHIVAGMEKFRQSH
jgi:hypothetical protein